MIVIKGCSGTGKGCSSTATSTTCVACGIVDLHTSGITGEATDGKDGADKGLTAADAATIIAVVEALRTLTRLLGRGLATFLPLPFGAHNILKLSMIKIKPRIKVKD